MAKNAETLIMISDLLNQLSDLFDQDKLYSSRRLARSGQYFQAQIELKNLALSDNNRSIEASLMMGKIYAQQGLFDRATKCWMFVLEREPDNQEAIKGLAAISRQAAKPLKFRVLQFLAGCLFIVCVALVIGVYIGNQLHEFDSHIATIENSHRIMLDSQQQLIEKRFNEFGSHVSGIESSYRSVSAKQEQLMKAQIGKLKQDYTGVTANLVKIDDAITILVGETAALKQAAMIRSKETTAKLSKIESDIIDNALVMGKKNELALIRLFEEISKIDANTKFNNAAIHKALEKQRAQRDDKIKGLEKQIIEIEQQFKAINATLESIKTNILNQTTNFNPTEGK